MWSQACLIPWALTQMHKTAPAQEHHWGCQYSCKVAIPEDLERFVLCFLSSCRCILMGDPFWKQRQQMSRHRGILESLLLSLDSHSSSQIIQRPLGSNAEYLASLWFLFDQKNWQDFQGLGPGLLVLIRQNVLWEQAYWWYSGISSLGHTQHLEIWESSICFLTVSFACSKNHRSFQVAQD